MINFSYKMMRMFKRIDTCFLFATMLLVACGKEDEIVVPIATPTITFEDKIDEIVMHSSVVTTDNSLSYRWTTTGSSIFIADADKSTASFRIPTGNALGNTSFSLSLSNKNNSNGATSVYNVPALTTVRTYGLGKSLVSERSNAVDYDWYLDQNNTGTYTLVNCGPTSVTMAIKWVNKNFTGTPVDARNTYRSGGGWWYTSDIINYLNKYSVPNITVPLTSMTVVQDEIDKGNIVLLCLDMFYVSAQNIGDYHFSKFYPTNAPEWGHFIVVKGYKKVDDVLYYETYDPYSLNVRYTAGELKGKDRYYLSTDLDKATNIWWDYAIVISKDKSNAGGRVGVDVNSIVHRSGQ